MLEKCRYPTASALFAVISLFIGTSFTCVDQQGTVHGLGFHTTIIGETLLLFSGIWFVRAYLAKRKRKN